MSNSLRSGMTMIEVLCATALASLLMVAVLGVVGGLARHEKALEKQAPPPAWHDTLTRQLTSDFQAATELEFRNDRVLLSGPLGREAGSGTATWADAVVTYRVAESEFGWTLLRSVRDRNSVGREDDVELVCVGAARLVIGSPNAGLDASLHAAAVLTDLRKGPPPPRLAVSILDDTNQPIFESALLLE